MRRLSTVLCAVDIHDDSRRVFAQALALARRHDAKLYVLHAAPPAVPFNRDATARVDFLRQLRSRAEAAGVDVRVEVQRGYVAEIILLHARARQVDLIVMGTSGRERRGLSGWLVEQVLGAAPCPTLIVPRAATGSPAPAFDRILCAVNFSPVSESAVNEALRIVAQDDGQLTLLHVANAAVKSETALETLRSLVPPARAASVSTEVVLGDPADEILRAAAATDTSLLVIGAGARSRIGGRLFGRTAALLRDATCPVLAVPIVSAADAHRVDRSNRNGHFNLQVLRPRLPFARPEFAQ